MKSRIRVSIPLALISFVLIGLTNVVQADYDYFSDQLSREHRYAGDVDDWIERGNATVTASPRFEDGIRLTAWADGGDNGSDYQFAIASAIYSFDIPQQAQYIEILVRYRGEPHEAEIEDYEPVAGRVWVRNTQREYSRQRYDDDNETLYGDTFVLRARRRSETIRITAAGHVDNGLLEMHIVAENGEQLDVEYIDVSTYRRQPDIRVIHRYAQDYRWRPWYDYTYLYFYEGPFYYCTDLGYYVRWSYPIYDRHYLSIRFAYRDYLHNYYLRYPSYYHPHYYRSYPNNVNVHVHVDGSVETRHRLNRWTADHEAVRNEYTRSRLSAASSSRTNTQTRVRTLIEKHRQEPVLADRVIQSSDVASKRRRIGSRTELNTARGTDAFSRSIRDSYTRSGREINDLLKQRRYPYNQEYRPSTEYRVSPSDRSQTSTYRKGYSYEQQDTRSNAERRAQLYRSRISTSQSNTAPAQRQSSVTRESPTKQRRSTSSSSRSYSAPERTRSSTTNQDDDDDDDRQNDRSRNTERTKRRRN